MTVGAFNDNLCSGLCGVVPANYISSQQTSEQGQPEAEEDQRPPHAHPQCPLHPPLTPQPRPPYS